MAVGTLNDAVRKAQITDALNGDGSEQNQPEEARTERLKTFSELETASHPNDQSIDDYPAQTQEQSPFQTESAQFVGTHPNDQSVTDYTAGSDWTSMASPSMRDTLSPDLLAKEEEVQRPVQQPGAVPSPLPPPSPAASDNVGQAQSDQLAGWTSMASPEMQAPPPRAELVRLPPTGPVSMASRDSRVPALRAERVLPPPEPVSAASRELDLAPSAQPVEMRRGELIPPEEYIDPDQAVFAQLEEQRIAQGYRPGMAPWEQVPPANVPGVVGQAQPAHPNDQSISDYIAPKAPPAGAAPKIEKAQVSSEEPVITNQAREGAYIRSQATRPVRGIILHSTDGTSVRGDLATLSGGDPAHKVSVHYLTGPDGQSYHLVSDNDIAFHAGQTRGPLAYLNNSNTIGIEQTHIDGQPWSEEQVKGTARTVASILLRHPELSIDDVHGHSDIAPERKQDPLNFPWDRFRSYVAQYMGQQPEGSAPIAQPANRAVNGFYKGEDQKSFAYGKATTFATPDDIRSGQDPGVGSPKLGPDGKNGLDTTQVAGMAVPEEVLREQLGNNPARWRTARVDVVDPSTGKRLRLPIVDLGPSTDALADMTPFVSNYFGGDKNLAFKLVANAGPDVRNNPGAWNDEQAAIRQGFDSSTLAANKPAKSAQAGFTLKAADPALGVALQQADQYRQAGMRDTITGLPENDQSPVALYKRLAQPVAGVNDAYRKNFQAALKDEITKEAQQFYNISDPAEAFKKATSDADFGTAASELGRNIMGHLTNIDVMFGRFSQGTDDNRVAQFAQLVHPEATPEGRTAFLKSLMALPPEQRAPVIMHLLENVDPEVRKTIDPTAIADSVDRMANPVYQKTVNDAIALKRAEVAKDLESDPRLKGSFTDKIIQLVGPIPAQTILALPSIVSGGAGAILTNSLFAAQIHSDTYDRIKAEHPDWSEAQVKEMTDKSTAFQLAPQVALTALHSGQLGNIIANLTEGGLGKRIIGNAVVHMGGGSTAAAAQQAAANIAEGKPVQTGVGQAAIAGAVQGIPGAAIGVVRGREQIAPERPQVAPEPPQVAPEGPQVVSARQILGPEVSEPGKWYKPPPIVTREQPGVWTPQTLAQAIRDLPASATPEEIARRVEQMQPPPSPGALREVHLGALEELPPPTVGVTQEEVARRTYEISQERQTTGQSGDALSDYAQAQQELARTPPLQRTEPAPMSEAEPMVSSIANRYTAEKMALGELGRIDPSEGQSTEKMVMNGMNMSPNQRERLINNFMQGKGGDLDQSGAAIRSKEMLLSEQSRAASRAAALEPTNAQAQAQAKAAYDAVTAFHNGPLKKYKQVWSDSGRVLQKEIPLDYTTLNGLKEAYLKNQKKEAPLEFEPKLKQMADVAAKASTAERAALERLSDEIGKEITGKSVPTDDQVRARLMAIMKDMPCPS